MNVDVVTFGQYMRPTKRHMKVDRYVLPEEYNRWKRTAEEMGFLYVASGPLVRSSYKVRGILNSTAAWPLIVQAGEFFIENVLKKRRAIAAEHATATLAAVDAPLAGARI